MLKESNTLAKRALSTVRAAGVQHSALLRHQFALFVHLLHRELFQIRQHDQIGGIARGYCAAVRKTEVLARERVPIRTATTGSTPAVMALRMI